MDKKEVIDLTIFFRTFTNAKKTTILHRKLLPILCLIGWLSGSLHGATDSLRYALTHYTNENGLPQNSVKSIAIDDAGFLWLATEAGAVRFDGLSFRLYNKRNTGMLTSRLVGIERNHADGALYALNDSWQMLLLDSGKAVLQKASVSERFRFVDPGMTHQSIVATTWRSGDFVDVYGRDTLQQNINANYAVVLSANGTIAWYRNKKETARQRLGATLDLFSTFTKDSTVYIFPRNPGGDIRRARPSGISSVAITGDIKRQSPFKEWVLCGNTATGNFFIYADKHCYQVTVLPDDTWHTRLLLTGFDFGKEQIICGYYDSITERLYLGSAYNGMFVFKRQRFEVKTANGLPGINNVFYEMIPFGRNAVLSGRGVLLSSDDTPPAVYDSLKFTRNSFGNAILKATDGTIWTANSDWLQQRTGDLKAVLRKWYMPYSYSLTQGGDGAIWIGTNKRGIFRLHPEASDTEPELFFPSDEYIICITQENKDVLWAGTEGHLYRINLRTRKATAIPELDNKIVRSIYIPHPGEVWICTYEDGLFLSNVGKLTHFALDKDGYLNSVHRILTDKKGFFWISTNNGLFKVLKADLLRYAEGKASGVFYQHFNKASGFYTNEFNGGSNQVAAILNNGVFAFSSMNGVVMFDPMAIKDDLPDKNIIIDELTVDGKKVAFKDSINLALKPSRILVKLATPYFGDHNNLQYEYKFSNADEDREWILLDNPVLVFTALPAGPNLITVRKMAGFGEDNYTLKTFVINVPYAWWETPIAWTAAFLSLLLLVWLLIHFRLRYLRHRNLVLQNSVKLRTAELSKIISRLEVSEGVLDKELNYQRKLNQSITHDIKTPLRYLTMTTKYMVEKIKDKKPIAEADMQQVYDGSRRIYEYADNLVGYMKSRLNTDTLVAQEVNLHALIRNLKGIFRNAMAEKKNQFINNIDPAATLLVHPQLLEILLHNLVDNAIKNTSEGKITFSTRLSDQWLTLYVTDSGRGMAKEKAAAIQAFLNDGHTGESAAVGLGMKMVKDILVLLKAQIVIESSKGSGATFSLLLPRAGGGD